MRAVNELSFCNYSVLHIYGAIDYYDLNHICDTLVK